MNMGTDARKPDFKFIAYEQQRRRPACASMQSDQCLCYSLIGKSCILSCYMVLLVSSAEQAGSSLIWLQTPKDRRKREPVALLLLSFGCLVTVNVM